MLILILALLFTACEKDEEPVDTSIPSNLSIEVLSVDNETMEVSIQANAQNTSQYHLYIGSSPDPEEFNETGYFEYTFEDNGVYSMRVRAYGTSGRYLASTVSINLEPEQPAEIPLDKGYFSPTEYAGYDLVWQDEFNANSINTQDWGFDYGNGVWGWGNNELEYYRSQNAWVTGDVLVIEAREENFGGKNYTSAKLKTKDKVSFKYGRVDIRALLPKGQGLWPALWMLGNNIDQVSWPDCGEIDIMEMIGGNGGERTIYGTIHWENAGEHASYGGSKTLPSSSDSYNEAYHVFSIVWDENTINWYVDNQLYHQSGIAGEDQNEFHQEYWLIFNVAVGGNWPGSPDATTFFPQQMRVDYVRVFQKN